MHNLKCIWESEYMSMGVCIYFYLFFFFFFFFLRGKSVTHTRTCRDKPRRAERGLPGRSTSETARHLVFGMTRTQLGACGKQTPGITKSK